MENPRIVPLTSDYWRDLEKLFGPRGACNDCWCMFWRLRGKAWSQRPAQSRQRGLKKLVDTGNPPGLIAYADGEPAGWVSLAPREDYPRLEHSRALKRIDAQPVWSVVCFFVAKPYRQSGMMSALLRAAIDYARDHGARILEGYPIEVKEKLTGDGGYTGVASTYRKMGFVPAQGNGKNTIMRYEIK